MRILIGADLVPTKSNISLFEQGNVEELLGSELNQILHSADYRIFNLEVPLTDVESPIAKCGLNLIAPTRTVNGYLAMQADVLTLANNHILDQGEQGLFFTCELLSKNKIAYLGAGRNPEEAAKPYTFESNGKKIGIYACAEHEFSIVSDKNAGANPYDPVESFDHVSTLKQQCNFVIVLYHGGKEHYRYPSPNIQKICRKFIEKGANLVICQHTHCVGCEEKYLNGTIVYGQGNFLFDGQENEFWNTSLLVLVSDDFSVSYLPLVKKKNCVRLADKDTAQRIMSGFMARSEEIKEDGKVEENYKRYVEKMLLYYLKYFCGYESFGYKVANKIVGKNRLRALRMRKVLKKNLYVIRNFIECEAHNELLICGLKNYINKPE